MESKKIWGCANELKELIRAIYRAVRERKNIDSLMSQLKCHIPCLVGLDIDKFALVFRSSDEGIVAVYVEEQDDTLLLAMGTNIELE